MAKWASISSFGWFINKTLLISYMLLVLTHIYTFLASATLFKFTLFVALI